MNSDMNVDGPRQDIHQPSTVSSQTTDLDSMSATPAMSNPGYGVDVESYLNVDAFLDTNFCGTSDVSGTWEKFTDTMLFKNHHGQINGPSFSEQQTILATKGESYLSPWPGSLAAIFFLDSYSLTSRNLLERASQRADYPCIFPWL